MKNNQEERDVIILVDENGNENMVELVNVVEVDCQKYAVVVNEEDFDKEECEADIYRIEMNEDDEEILVGIEDDDEFYKVCDYLDELEIKEIKELLTKN